MCVCVDVCPHNNSKTIADICFVLSSYIDWRKISYKFANQHHRSRLFSTVFKVTIKVVRYSVMGSEIPSPVASSFMSNMLSCLRPAFFIRIVCVAWKILLYV